MKKLTTLFILIVLFCFDLFANPKIPKTDNYFNTLNPDTNNVYSFVNDSCQNVYRIFAVVNEDDNCLYFTNKSYITNIEISITITFHSESDLDEFIKKINTSDLEGNFSSLRKFIIQMGVKPTTFLDENNNIEKVMYICNY